MNNSSQNQSVLQMSASQIASAVRSQSLTATHVIAEFSTRIKLGNAKLNSLTQTFLDDATTQAIELDKKIAAGKTVGKLAGVPIALKENICSKVGKTTCCSKILENFSANYDATVVKKLIAADAIIIGKANMDEFAMGSSCETSAISMPVNPWDITRVPGGSSGGSAAAVAARFCPAALGSDTGGSIRQPAGFTGTVGLKPTTGLVSRFGLVAFASSLDQIGPICTNVEDAALLLQVLAGVDPQDSTSVDKEFDFISDLHKPIGSLKIGLPVDIETNPWITDSAKEAIQRSVELLKSAGAKIIPIDLEYSKVSEQGKSVKSLALATYQIVSAAECSSNLARLDGVRFGYRAPGAFTAEDVYKNSRTEGFGAEVTRRILLGTYCLSADFAGGLYQKASKVRKLIANDFAHEFQKCDAIICPTSPSSAFKIGAKKSPMQMHQADIFTVPASLAGLPAISIPAGFDDENLPVATQLIAPAFEDAKLLRIANQLENLLRFEIKLPDLP